MNMDNKGKVPYNKRPENRKPMPRGPGGNDGMGMGNQSKPNPHPQMKTEPQNQGPKKDFVKERLDNLSGPTTNLQTKEGVSKKFTGRCRLFVGNLPNSTTEEEFKSMFTQFGEVAEVFLHKQKGFGFVKLDTRQNAESAKASLDFTLKEGKYLRVRFATHGAALKVKNLSPWVSNELLETAFSIFGDVERAVVIVDDRGRPVGEGIIEFSRKQSAQLALKRCTEGCFLLTSALRPVIVETFEQRDEEDGLPEKNFQRNNKQYIKEREVGPRLAEVGTFEFDFANRWKKLYELEQQKRNHLEKEIEEGRRALDEQTEYAIYEHEANLLRERLRHMEEQSSILQREREIRKISSSFISFSRDNEMRREEMHRQQEMIFRQQQEELLRCRPGENMMMAMQGGSGMSPAMGGDHMGSNSGPGGYGPNVGNNGMMPGMPPSRFDQLPMGPGFTPSDPMGDMGSGVGGGNMRGGQHDMENRDDYQVSNKRRRY